MHQQQVQVLTPQVFDAFFTGRPTSHNPQEFTIQECMIQGMSLNTIQEATIQEVTKQGLSLGVDGCKPYRA